MIAKSLLVATVSMAAAAGTVWFGTAEADQGDGTATHPHTRAHSHTTRAAGETGEQGEVRLSGESERTPPRARREAEAESERSWIDRYMRPDEDTPQPTRRSRNADAGSDLMDIMGEGERDQAREMGREAESREAGSREDESRQDRARDRLSRRGADISSTMQDDAMSEEGASVRRRARQDIADAFTSGRGGGGKGMAKDNMAKDMAEGEMAEGEMAEVTPAPTGTPEVDLKVTIEDGVTRIVRTTRTRQADGSLRVDESVTELRGDMSPRNLERVMDNLDAGRDAMDGVRRRPGDSHRESRNGRDAGEDAGESGSRYGSGRTYSGSTPKADKQADKRMGERTDKRMGERMDRREFGGSAMPSGEAMPGTMEMDDSEMRDLFTAMPGDLRWYRKAKPEELLDAAENIEDEDLRDQALFAILTYSLRFDDFDAARSAIEEMQDGTLSDNAQGRLAIRYAETGEIETALDAIGELEDEELRDIIRVQMIETLTAPVSERAR